MSIGNDSSGLQTIYDHKSCLGLFGMEDCVY